MYVVYHPGHQDGIFIYLFIYLFIHVFADRMRPRYPDRGDVHTTDS